MENITEFNEMVDYVASNSGATTTESAAAVGGIAGFFAGVGLTALVVCLVVWVLTIIALWRIFTKAGEKGWKSIIPIYNAYIYFKIIGLSFWKWFGVLLLAGIVSSIGASSEIAALATIGGILEGVLTLVLNILVARNTGRAFGKGTGFKVGLFFLPTLFQLILGLGASEYKGATTEE